MKIKMLATAASDGTEYLEGEEYDVGFALASHFIELGYATHDEEA